MAVSPMPVRVPVPIDTPSWLASLASQRSVVPAANVHMKNVTVPVGVSAGLLPTTVAVSWTGSPGKTESSDTAVVISASHGANSARTKSFSVASVDVEAA